MAESNHGKAQSSTFYHQHSSNTDASPATPPLEATPHKLYYQSVNGHPGPGPQLPPCHQCTPPLHGYPWYWYNQYGGNAPYHDVTQDHDAGNRARRWIHCFVIGSCIILACLIVSTLIVILITRPEYPVFKVNSLTVTNFNTTVILSGEWKIFMSVYNPNTKLKGYFVDFRVDVLNDNHQLAMSYIPSFELDKHEEKQMYIRASSKYIVNFISFQKWDLDKMSNYKQSGSILFSLKVSSVANFNSSLFAMRTTTMSAICEGLKVGFQNTAGTGSLDNGGIPVTCQRYM